MVLCRMFHLNLNPHKKVKQNPNAINCIRTNGETSTNDGIKKNQVKIKHFQDRIRQFIVFVFFFVRENFGII